MKLSGLFKSAAKTTQSQALAAESRQLLKQNLGELSKFTQKELPQITKTHVDAMTALEQLGRQAQAALKNVH
ncbi:hypothetical protein IKQ26_00430 [bacterium]|nr:hypothetical protein [bacterium]